MPDVAKMAADELWRQIEEILRQHAGISQMLALVELRHRLERAGKDSQRYREALAWAAISLDSYEQSYGGGGGDTEALDIAKLLGFDGNTNEAIDWLRASVRSLEPQQEPENGTQEVRNNAPIRTR